MRVEIKTKKGVLVKDIKGIGFVGNSLFITMGNSGYAIPISDIYSIEFLESDNSKEQYN